MFTTIRNGNLSAALKLAAGAISTRTSLPVLKNILIDAAGDRLRLAGTDLEVSIEAHADAEVKEPGAVTTRENELTSLLAGFDSDAEIRLEQAGDWIKLLSGRSAYRLPTLSSEEFPSLPDVEGVPDEEKAILKIPLGEFRQAVGRVAPFASTDETRPVLTTVCVRTGDGLTLAATDTHRLSVLTLPPIVVPVLSLPPVVVPASDYLLPAKTLARIGGFPGADADEVEILLTPNLARFSAPSWRVMTRTIEGKYPQYERVMPNGNSKIRWELDTEELAAALRRVRVLAKDQAAAERVALHPYEGGLQIRSSGSVAGDGVEDIALEQEGDAVDAICFNARYLLGVCSVLGTKMRMAITDPLAPVLCTGDEEGHRMILMPMQP
jgi:DNA polymerase III subunit beta